MVLPKHFGPEQPMGFLDPHSSDGRVIFYLPWEKHIVAGTTDSPTKADAMPAPSKKDIDFLVSELKRSLSPEIKVMQCNKS